MSLISFNNHTSVVANIQNFPYTSQKTSDFLDKAFSEDIINRNEIDISEEMKETILWIKMIQKTSVDHPQPISSDSFYHLGKNVVRPLLDKTTDIIGALWTLSKKTVLAVDRRISSYLQIFPGAQAQSYSVQKQDFMVEEEVEGVKFAAASKFIRLVNHPRIEIEASEFSNLEKMCRVFNLQIMHFKQILKELADKPKKSKKNSENPIKDPRSSPFSPFSNQELILDSSDEEGDIGLYMGPINSKNRARLDFVPSKIEIKQIEQKCHHLQELKDLAISNNISDPEILIDEYVRFYSTRLFSYMRELNKVHTDMIMKSREVYRMINEPDPSDPVGTQWKVLNSKDQVTFRYVWSVNLFK